jgi:hypothetical protein
MKSRRHTTINIIFSEVLMLGRGAAIVWRGLERPETMNCNCNTANNVGVRAPSIRQQQKLSVDVEYGEYQTNIMISLTKGQNHKSKSQAKPQPHQPHEAKPAKVSITAK